MLFRKAITGLKRRLFPEAFRFRNRYDVGRDTYGEPQVFHWGEPATLRVGSFCSFAGGVKIFLGGNHRVDWVTTFPFSEFRDSARHITGHPQTKGDVIIGNDVWIAENCVILSGVTIGDGAVIGAGSVVTKDVSPYAIAAGNPASFIRNRFGDEDIALLQGIAWWNWSDAKIDQAMPLLLSNQIKELAAFAEAHKDMA